MSRSISIIAQLMIFLEWQYASRLISAPLMFEGRSMCYSDIIYMSLPKHSCISAKSGWTYKGASSEAWPPILLRCCLTHLQLSSDPRLDAPKVSKTCKIFLKIHNFVLACLAFTVGYTNKHCSMISSGTAIFPYTFRERAEIWTKWKQWTDIPIQTECIMFLFCIKPQNLLIRKC